MTTEETIAELNGLIKTCKDGELGYSTAAADVRNTELESVFTEYAKQRGQFARHLQAEVEGLWCCDRRFLVGCRVPDKIRRSPFAPPNKA